jgi:hypothetical protein
MVPFSGVYRFQGFNYNFQAMQGEPNELNVAFSHVFESGTSQMDLPVLLKLFFPILRLLVSRPTKYPFHQLMRRGTARN